MEKDLKRIFVKCDCCNKKIYLGDEIYQYDGFCGIYCSAECYAAAHATTRLLTRGEISNCCAKAYLEETKTVTTEKELSDKEYDELVNKHIAEDDDNE